MMTIFRLGGAAEQIRLDLGLCHQPNGPPCHWSRVTVQYYGNHTEGIDDPEAHSCYEHHISSWPSYTKDFGDADRTVRISFTPCKRAPTRTLVVHLQLFGHVYEEILREAGVTFPPAPKGANTVPASSGPERSLSHGQQQRSQQALYPYPHHSSSPRRQSPGFIHTLAPQHPLSVRQLFELHATSPVAAVAPAVALR